jgi:prephenate dehydratase
MKRMRVAYLGPPGTFGEQAAIRYAPDEERIPFPSHSQVAAAVQAGQAEAGLLAVENSLEGSVSETVDILVHDAQLRICGELALPIEQCLIVPPGRRAAQVRVILSHTNALGQCRSYLEQHFPDARLEPALSTTSAVEQAMARDDAAAIASARAAELLGGEIVERGIQDRKNNVTRFVIVGQSDAAPTGDDKTSLAFTTYHDRPGSLVGVLQEFATRGLNLTKIESRPSRDALGVYVFLCDFQGHRSDVDVAAALEAVREKTQTLQVIGSYPRFIIG